jgi:hypothetical protein
MKFYQIDTDVGPQLVVRKDEAKKLDPQYRQVDIPTDSDGLRNHLNALMAIQKARSEDVKSIPVEFTDYKPPAAASYVHTSVALDEQWEALPLARKLHFAALAMEDARNAL